MARSALYRHLTRLARQALQVEEMRLDRRQTVGLLAKAALGTAALAACQRTVTASSVQDDNMAMPLDYGVAIVGAGAAGMTVAYRLTKANVACRVYDAQNRVGGRMWTERGVNTDGQFVERGGELVDTQHTDLIQLCGELGLPLEDFAAGDTGLAHDLFYAQGHVRTEAEIIGALAPLAMKLAADRTKLKGADGSVAVPTYNSSLGQLWATQNMDNTTLAAYLDAANIDQWLRQMIDAAYVGEFGLETAQQSALNLITLLTPETTNGFHIFGDSDEAKRIKGGSDVLPKTLASAVAKTVPVNLGQTLVKIVDAGSSFVLTFNDGTKSNEVKASLVVLALPFSVLRGVEGLAALNLSPTKLKCIRELGYGTNAKVMTSFTSRLWRTGPAKSRGTVITTQASQAFWETSRLQPGNSGILTNFVGGAAGLNVGNSRVPQILADLEVLFPGVTATYDGKSVIQSWAAVPQALGSYSCPLPGQYTTIWGAGGESELNGRLLCCGEHCSNDYGGYMNGAVESGNHAAGQILASLGLSDGRSAARAAAQGP